MSLFSQHSLFLIHTLLLWATGVIADDNQNNIFNIPGPSGPNNNYEANLVWPFGSIQTIDFYTDVNSWTMALTQQNLDGNDANIVQNIASETINGHITAQWNVSNYNSSLQYSPVFFLWINYGNPNNFTSHYFNITAQSASSTAASTSTATATATTSATSGAAATTTSATITTSRFSSNVTGRKVGLGVGLGLGIPLIAAALGFAAWRARSRRRNKQPSLVGNIAMKKWRVSTQPAQAYRDGPESFAVYEAPTESEPVELPSEEHR